MVTIMKRAKAVCTCSAYSFPHRATSGACHDDGSGCFCGSCGQPAEAVARDFGYGPLEAWGHCFTHRDERTVSRCCEADLFADASLNQPYEA
jgi:hypothetical protein